MSLQSIGSGALVRLLRNSSRPALTSVRTLIVAPRRRTSKPRRRSPSQENDILLDQQKQREIKLLDKKLEEVRQFTGELKLDIAKRDEERVMQEMIRSDEHTAADSDDIDVIYGELMGKTNDESSLLISESSPTTKVSLFDEPARGINIPANVLSRIGDSVKYIVAKNNQDWNSVIRDLHESADGLKELPKADIYGFLGQIPVGGLDEQSLAQIHEMIMDCNIIYAETTYDFMMKHYAELNHPVIVQKLFDTAVQAGVKPSKYMFGHLIKVYCKSHNLERVNLALNKMFSNGLEPSKKVYTNVLQMCVNTNDQYEADEIFQMMKFRSLQSQPDTEAYNTMIQLAAKTGNVHRALDLYQEMQDSRLTPTVFTYNSLALACSKNSDFLRRGWEFIHQIHGNNFEPTSSTFEIMLRLAAKDGDLELARALYVKIFEMRPSIPTAGSAALNYLMLAYRDFKPDRVPQVTLYREGFIIRRNILNMVDFLGLHQTIVNDAEIQKIREVYPPMLPVRGLQLPEHIIAESNAIWAFNMSNDPSVLTIGALQTYLRVAVEQGDKAEFMKRYEQFTYSNSEINKSGIINDEIEPMETDIEEVSGPPVLKLVKQLNLKIERESSLYVTLLSAGRRFHDEQMCQMAWIERGQYRKTSAYQKLDHLVKKRLDYQFSREMVSALLELKLYTDAVGVVLSSTQFAWSFYHLKPLYVALVEIGDEKNARAISQICSKSKK